MQKVTINVVAKHAGVSKKTVSRVLNDEPNVSDKTRDRVLSTFEELGYRPSQQARGLASNQSFLIGLVYDNPNKSYVSDIQEGALSVCDKTGYHLLIHPANHESEHLLSNVDSLVYESRLDGLVLTPPFSDMQPLLDMLDQRNIHYVRIGATTLQSHSPCVTSNDTEAAFLMTRYLISLGHTKIGFIKGHPDHSVTEQRYQGYCNALEQEHIELNENFVEQGYFDFASGEECGRRLLAQEERPTAIFASNDYMAAGVVKVASQRKIAVPHDLSVTGFDNAPISRYLWPSLTTIKQPIREMAAQAIKLLIDGIRDKVHQPKAVQLDGEMVTRESTTPLR